MRDHPKILFPALTDISLDDWVAKIIRTSAEEQVLELGTNVYRRKKCRLKCNADETAYHVLSACITPAYTTRHNIAVYWLLRYILRATNAPEEISSQLKYGSGSLVVEYMSKERQVKIIAGPKVITEPSIYHNRPDVLIKLTNPSMIYVLEVSISHLQKRAFTKKIKKNEIRQKFYYGNNTRKCR